MDEQRSWLAGFTVFHNRRICRRCERSDSICTKVSFVSFASTHAFANLLVSSVSSAQGRVPVRSLTRVYATDSTSSRRDGAVDKWSSIYCGCNRIRAKKVLTVTQVDVSAGEVQGASETDIRLLREWLPGLGSWGRSKAWRAQNR